jgi:hypothetical protein
MPCKHGEKARDTRCRLTRSVFTSVCPTHLAVDLGVPVEVVDDDGIGARQVDPQAPGPRREQEHPRRIRPGGVIPADQVQTKRTTFMSGLRLKSPSSRALSPEVSQGSVTRVERNTGGASGPGALYHLGATPAYISS